MPMPMPTHQSFTPIGIIDSIPSGENDYMFIGHTHSARSEDSGNRHVQIRRILKVFTDFISSLLIADSSTQKFASNNGYIVSIIKCCRRRICLDNIHIV